RLASWPLAVGRAAADESGRCRLARVERDVQQAALVVEAGSVNQSVVDRQAPFLQHRDEHRFPLGALRTVDGRERDPVGTLVSLYGGQAFELADEITDCCARMVSDEAAHDGEQRLKGVLPLGSLRIVPRRIR